MLALLQAVDACSMSAMPSTIPSTIPSATQPERHRGRERDKLSRSVVAQHLHWFDVNAHICPEYVLDTVHMLKMSRMNDVLLLRLESALSAGMASGSVGSVDYSSVTVTELHTVLQQADEYLSIGSPDFEEKGKSEEIVKMSRRHSALVIKGYKGQLHMGQGQLHMGQLHMGQGQLHKR